MTAARTDRVIVVGAGIGGLAAAYALAARGLAVTVFERSAAPGGKIRQAEIQQAGIGTARIDSGPTVFTMRWVFDELFAAAGETFTDHVRLHPLEVLARHAWDATVTLDLFADEARTIDAIGTFAGSADARGYARFCTDTRRIFEILEQPFLRATEPSLGGLISANNFRGMADLPRIRPFTTMWKALGEYFRDPRLQQLFGRYATYCGSSPYHAPATLMLIAHVEREGVWSIDGGMQALALAMANAASAHGATIRYGANVAEIRTDSGRVSGIALADGEQIAADAVVLNADVAALAGGLFGASAARAASAITPDSRSLSATTWSMVAQADGFPLSRHTVFFSRNYRAEFEDIFQRHVPPSEPTVYVCAQDRDAQAGDAPIVGKERLFVLANAPATGDRNMCDAAEIERRRSQTFGTLARCGLTIDHQTDATQVTTPADFAKMFPGSGGALYGRSSHGWTASFQRPGARTKVPGLYLAGGSVHPGPGVPMAALSGRAAAASLLADSGHGAPTSRPARRALT